ncbi:hypothetical protein [Taibaiella chishuiensis]|uniref:Short chain amide porin n=1 Tax=Taibaiella chishuiensis TaxID=1434707 RepID=A0A2P8D486_9BACT|nr:hypothetical protein [Taibaiella chishuiensis]PSK92030.1 hypothetical protein B0I18_104124 [Taibaiella chishuiensis]
MALLKWPGLFRAIPLLLLAQGVQAQNFIKDRKLYLNESGSSYVKFTVLGQFWLRQQELNPGTTINGTPKDNSTDIGIRRLRMQVYGQLTDRAFFYVQLGQNNFNNISDRKQGFFVHDAYGEYAIVKQKLSLGAGLSGWSGLSRFSSPSAGTIMGVDAPLHLQSTNDVTDQFLRKLSVFAKGKIGRFDYRLVMAQPHAIQKSAGYNGAISLASNFSPKAPSMQWNGYFQWQFLDQESNLTPYTQGTYLGAKRVLNIGAGFIYQKDALWRTSSARDTLMEDMAHFSGDVYYDAPAGPGGQALNLYASVAHYGFGKNYIRNQATMNPANGNTNPDVLNGSGNGYPAFGTGTTVYAQAGYKLRDSLIGSTTLMPYIALQYADYDRLNDKMLFVDAGINWLLSGHTSKLTLSYQNRPIYNAAGDQTKRLGAFTLQYQVFFN